MTEIKDENQKQYLSLSDKLVLGMGWLFIVCQFIVATLNLYFIISGRFTFNTVLNVIFGYTVVLLFQKNKDKLFLSKGYFLLSLFFVMAFSVIYVLTGKIDANPAPNTLLAVLIMAVGVVLILYLYRKFFTEFKHIIKFEPPIRIEPKNSDEE